VESSPAANHRQIYRKAKNNRIFGLFIVLCMSNGSSANSGARPWAMSVAFVETSGDPQADRRFNYACDLAARGELDAAIDLIEQTLTLVPGFASAWFALGEWRLKTGARENAAQAFGQAVTIDPQDRRGARLHLIRLGAWPGQASAADRESGHDGLPPEMPADYVKALFDQFAPRFDETLLNKLDYCSPLLLRAAVGRVCAARGRVAAFENAIDLGCGTGLGARAFRDITRAMAGVDLSPAMLARARAGGLYTTLAEMDMLTALQGAPAQSCDLVLAADAVIYLADLAPLCAQIARVLARQGLFAFTLETHEGQGVILGEKLRYAHAPAYVSALIAATGLDVAEMVHASARQDGGMPVPGLVIVAQRA